MTMMKQLPSTALGKAESNIKIAFQRHQATRTVRTEEKCSDTGPTFLLMLLLVCEQQGSLQKQKALNHCFQQSLSGKPL
jgi:hypothetical protein